MVNLRHRAKFRGDQSNRCGNMAFFHFQDGGRRHVGFLKCRNFNSRKGQDSRGQNCVIVPNFVAISQPVAEIWRFFDFSKMAAVRHLGFVMRIFRPPAKGI